MTGMSQFFGPDTFFVCLEHHLRFIRGFHRLRVGLCRYQAKKRRVPFTQLCMETLGLERPEVFRSEQTSSFVMLSIWASLSTGRLKRDLCLQSCVLVPLLLLDAVRREFS